MNRTGVFLFLFALLVLSGGCIQIQPRHPENRLAGPGPVSSPEKPAVRPAPGKELRAYEFIMLQIRRQRIRWEDISRYPAPEQPWREERFRLLRPDGEIRPEDFILLRVAGQTENRTVFTFSFRPLRVAYDGRTVWDTQIVFTFNPEGELADIRMHSKLIPKPVDGLFRLSGPQCNAISSAVLKALFRLHLPDRVRAAERFRFCFPLNGSDPDFRNFLRPRARIPELDPYEEYPDFPVPFEKGRYRAFTHGAFYYYAGIVLPVTENEVWVFDTAVIYAGGHASGSFYKLKKGLFLWEIVTEGSYDAPSRAVKEKEES